MKILTLTDMLTIALAAAALLVLVTAGARAQTTCQTLGKFTYCNGASGATVTCQRIGNFTYCN